MILSHSCHLVTYKKVKRCALLLPSHLELSQESHHDLISHGTDSFFEAFTVCQHCPHPQSLVRYKLNMRLLFLLSSAAVLATAKPIGSVSTDSVGGPAPSPHQLEASATWPRFYTYHDRHDTQYDSAAAIVDDKALKSRNDIAEPEQVLPLELETHSRPMDFCFDDYCCSGSRCGMVPANEHAEFLEARGDDAMYDRDYSLEPRAAGGPRDHFCWSPQDPMCQPDPPAAQIKAREARNTDVKSGTVDWLAAHPPRRYCWSDLDPLCSGPPLEGRRVNSQHGSKRPSQAKARRSFPPMCWDERYRGACVLPWPPTKHVETQERRN